MSTVGNNLEIPSFIKASSPQGLYRLMLLNNVKFGTRFKYQDIQFVNGYWYAWFYKTLDFKEQIKELNSNT